jgi:hypothetical protein
MTSTEKLISGRYKLTKGIMIDCLKLKASKSKKWFISGKKIKVNNRMQKNYTYTLTFNCGTKLTDGGFDDNGNKISYPDFNPKYSPGTMLQMGVFEGKYCNDQIFEFPKEWYSNISKFSPEFSNYNVNYFKIKSRQSLQEWRRKKWIPCSPDDNDTRGWFEWFCRYYLGRRQHSVDKIQINRWKSFNRHSAQVKKNNPGQLNKRTKQRQALLQWSYDAKV